MIIQTSLDPTEKSPFSALLDAGGARLLQAQCVYAPSDLIRRAGEHGWSGVNATSDGRAFRIALRRALRGLPSLQGCRTLVVSTDRGIGREGLQWEEWRSLRPSAEETLAQLIEAIGVSDVAVLLELPGERDLYDSLVVDAVLRGDDPAGVSAQMTAQGLIERVSRVPGVGRLIVAEDDGTAPGLRLESALAESGINVVLSDLAPARATPRWTLRSLLAAHGASSGLSDPIERSLVRGALRTMLAAQPSRPPQAIVPRKRRSGLEGAVYVGASGFPISRLHLHVGLQKTATTTAQAAFHAARATLAKQGVVYVHRREMDVDTIPDMRAWGAFPHNSRSKFPRFASQLGEVIRKHQQRSEDKGLPSDVVFMSYEDLVGTRRYGPQLERPLRPLAEQTLFELFDVLQPAEAALILVVRRQDTLLESSYMWEIGRGGGYAIDGYVASAIAHLDSLSFRGLANRLERIVGVTKLDVFPMEAISGGLNAFLNRMLATMGVAVDFDELPIKAVRNASMQPRQLALMRDVNPWLRGKDEVELLRTFVCDSLLKDEKRGDRPLGDGARQSLIDAYAADNEILFRERMPTYPIDAYSRLDTSELLGGGAESVRPSGSA